jgi:hypothetical protein
MLRVQCGLAARALGPKGANSHLTGAPPFQRTAVPLGRPSGPPIADCNGYDGGRRRRRGPIEVTGRGIGRTDPLLDDSDDLNDSRRLADPRAHLVTGSDGRRWLCRSVVDSHVSSAARRCGVRPRLRQPDGPQPPVHTGRLHVVHHEVPAARRSSSRASMAAACRRKALHVRPTSAWVLAFGSHRVGSLCPLSIWIKSQRRS